jgi:hypothetical protein
MEFKNLIEFLRKRIQFKTYFFFSLIIISFVFLTPQAKAAQSEYGLTKNIASILHLKATNESEQKGEIDSIDNKIIDGAELFFDPEVHVSLNDRLKAFLSFKTLPAIKALFEKKNDTIYRAFFGIRIAL